MVVVLVSVTEEKLMVRLIGERRAIILLERSAEVSPEAIVLGFRLTRARNFFGIDEMSCPPVALDESPRASYVNRIPTVPESVVLETDPWLVAGRLAVALYDHAVQSCVTAKIDSRSVGGPWGALV